MNRDHEIRAVHKSRQQYGRRLAHPMFLALSLLMCGFSLGADAGRQVDPSGESRWAILAGGISGEPALQKQYLKELVSIRTVLEGPLRLPGDHIFLLFDDPALDPGRIQFQSTRENLARVCKEIAGHAGKEDLVFVFLAGHGDADGKTYKFNMVGPDPTGEELAAMFYSIPARRFVVINTTNCSGASLQALSGKGRTIVTATRSGAEKNLTHLAGSFIEAFVDNNADVDKNGRVSIFEAFNYAARKIEEYYTKDGSLQTEHPVLNDNGDAQSLTLAETTGHPDLLSRAIYLDRGSPLFAAGDSSPETQALVQEARSLEKQVELLKSMKDEMTEAEYEKRLEAILLRLAEIQARLKKK